MRHGGRDEHDLRGRRQVAVDVVDLFLEASVEHLICLVQDQHLDVTCAEVALLDHVEDSARCTRHDVHSGLEGVDVVRDSLAADAHVDLHVQVIAQSQADLLTLLCELACWRKEERLRLPGAGVHGLERAQAEDAGLARATLRLNDHITTLEDWQDGTLLHGRGALEAVGINAAQQVLLQAQRVKGWEHLNVLGCLEDKPLIFWCLGHDWRVGLATSRGWVRDGPT
mmetsp:Transcript_42016/g.68047  ORF Transcript_42016/g.68047 Transcript_42016/m.68047 type:complete len:226 (+) Transcript_42016:629-1306(+)